MISHRLDKNAKSSHIQLYFNICSIVEFMYTIDLIKHLFLCIFAKSLNTECDNKKALTDSLDQTQMEQSGVCFLFYQIFC